MMFLIQWSAALVACALLISLYVYIDWCAGGGGGGGGGKAAGYGTGANHSSEREMPDSRSGSGWAAEGGL